jgi:hypothetical protein
VSYSDWALTAVILTILAVIASMLIAYRMGYSDGWHEGRSSEHARQSVRRIRENRAAAVASPATAARPPWHITVRPASTPGTRRHAHVTAIPPQAPRLDSGPGTTRFPALLTDTGEFRALAKASTDDWISRLEADGDAYRAQIRQELTT